jgi:subtilisin family serine protease
VRRWSDLDDDSLWVHVENVAGLVEAGLRQPGRRTGMQRGRVVVSAADQAAARAAVSALPGVELLAADTLLPIIKLRVGSPEALGRLRRLPHLEYVEPGAFPPAATGRGLDWNDGSGCSAHFYDGPWDNSLLWPGDLLPWNYRRMWIDSAWAWSTGRGVRVGLVDTGIDEGVRELNEYFTTGLSAGRSFIKEATRPYVGNAAPWHDTCGHGTRMASVVGAPRNGGYIMGVAYGADLYAVRVDDDVILSEVEATRYGIRRAATYAQIVTLAFGTPFHYSSIAQELDYWYWNSDRLIFAAAGTSPCWEPVKSVTFPGYLLTVITVTAFDYSGSIACNAHRGPEVDFAAYTDQPASGLSYLEPNLAGLAGSSGATAVMAGVTALYLSRNPAASRSQVLSALTVAASPTGGRSPIWGFGVPNVMCLMGEMCAMWIEGPSLIQTSGTYTWRAYQAGSPGPVAYLWNSGETTQTITRYVSVTPGTQEYTFTVGVTARDTRNGRQRFDAKSVTVRDPYGCPTCF